MKLTEILGVFGFILAFITFIITRCEKRKKLVVHLKFENLVNIDRNFLKGEKNISEIRLITVEVINDSTQIISLDIESLEIECNNVKIKHFFELVGKDKFRNPLRPGEKHQFGIFVEEFVSSADIPNRHNGAYLISGKMRDIAGKTYKTKGVYILLLEIDEILSGNKARPFINRKPMRYQIRIKK